MRGITLVEDAKDLAETRVAVAQAVPTEKIVQEVERRGGKVVRDLKDPGIRSSKSIGATRNFSIATWHCCVVWRRSSGSI